jgi:hypothetical protein
MGDPRVGVSGHLTPTKKKKNIKWGYTWFFPVVFSADAKFFSFSQHSCALCVKNAWSAQQQLGFVTPSKERLRNVPW